MLTKTFAGMLDNNGFIDHGGIYFHDEEFIDTVANINPVAARMISGFEKRLNEDSKLELGSATYREILALEKERKERLTLSEEAAASFDAERKELAFRRAEVYNFKQMLDSSREKEKIREVSRTIAAYDQKLRALEKRKKVTIREHKRTTRGDASYNRSYSRKRQELEKRYRCECAGELSTATRERNKILAKEIYLSLSRYPSERWPKLTRRLFAAMKDAMRLGVDLNDESQRNGVFHHAMFRVQYLDETDTTLHGLSVLNLARTDCVSDWTQIRGRKIATIFQDPMTSLSPIMPIGKQITSVIMKHQNVSELEARKRAIVLMKKVGIPNAENRFDDYPFQYSGGMRQRIVIAIALSCQPKILICDEPTTALDVTIQAQILKLIKDLQKEFGYTIIFITHDLGVVANVADRVAVLYAGQIIEIGKVEEIFYDPRHPYTWALLSSLPQLMDRGKKLYSIAGTPPSLYNKITGDAFAPRNPYCLKVDTLKEPPMFRVTDTHYAKTWLLDPRAPKIEKPEIIHDIHGTLMKVFNI